MKRLSFHFCFLMFQHSIPEMCGKSCVFFKFKSYIQNYDLLKYELAHCVLQISSTLQAFGS